MKIDMTWGRLFLFILICTFFVPQVSGQQVSEETLSSSIGSGARALAMGGAFIAIADDATAASWNPAGLCFLEKPELSFALLPINKVTTRNGAYQYDYYGSTYHRQSQYESYDFAQSGSNIDFTSFAWPLRFGNLKIVPQLSYQRAINGRMNIDMSRNYQIDRNYNSGRNRSWQYNQTYQRAGGGGLDLLSPSVGISFTSKLYLGVSFNYWLNDVTIKGTRDIAWTGREGSRTWEDTEKQVTDILYSYEGLNVNIGAIYKPTQKLRFGMVFKSPFSMDYSETYSNNYTFSYASADYYQYDEMGTIKWPRTIGVGVAVLPQDNLTISMDYTTSQWSTAQYEYIWSDSDGRGDYGDTEFYPTFYDSGAAEQGYNRSQLNTYQIRFGTEYVLTEPKMANLVVLPLRAGVFLDRQLFRESDLSDVSFVGISTGVGLVWSQITVDIAYVHIMGSYLNRGDMSFWSGETLRVYNQQEQDKFSADKLYISTTIRIAR